MGTSVSDPDASRFSDPARYAYSSPSCSASLHVRSGGSPSQPDGFRVDRHVALESHPHFFRLFYLFEISLAGLCLVGTFSGCEAPTGSAHSIFCIDADWLFAPIVLYAVSRN
ncbi:hypothetical protein L1887_57184 [Cichorium endivia]|nr:hypothetical protein L1887_57184 [Cichorium endivia]